MCENQKRSTIYMTSIERLKKSDCLSLKKKHVHAIAYNKKQTGIFRHYVLMKEKLEAA